MKYEVSTTSRYEKTPNPLRPIGNGYVLGANMQKTEDETLARTLST